MKILSIYVIMMLLSAVGLALGLGLGSSSPIVFGDKIVFWITMDFLLLHFDAVRPVEVGKKSCKPVSNRH